MIAGVSSDVPVCSGRRRRDSSFYQTCPKRLASIRFKLRVDLSGRTFAPIASENFPMSHAKQGLKRKRRRKAVPILRAAGLSLSLAGAANAATDRLPTDLAAHNTRATHEITLAEEEIADVSLATFYVFDRERAAPTRSGRRLASSCGGCGCGCSGCSGCGGCWTGTNYSTSVFGTPKPAPAPQHKRVPKNP